MHRSITALAAALVAPAWHAPAARLYAQASHANARASAPLEILTDGHGAYVSTVMRLRLHSSRPGELVQWETSDPARAWISSNGILVFTQAGRITITARRGSDSAVRSFDVRENPVERVSLTAPAAARVGERVHVDARALDHHGSQVTDEAVNVAASKGATVDANGEFVAAAAGTYTVTAQAGASAATRTIVVTAPRVELQGEVHSQDRQSHQLTAARVTLTTDVQDAFVGDSLQLHVDAIAAGARPVEGARVVYGVTEPGSTDGVHATVTPDGRFVATRAGVYTIFAAIGDRADQETLLVQQRPMR